VKNLLVLLLIKAKIQTLMVLNKSKPV